MRLAKRLLISGRKKRGIGSCLSVLQRKRRDKDVVDLDGGKQDADRIVGRCDLAGLREEVLLAGRKRRMLVRK